jgi:hypothetical protein
MRLLLTIVQIAVIAAIAEYFLPWYFIAIAAFIVGIGTKLSTGRAFLAGFIAIATVWLIFALIADIPNHHILSSRMAQLFKLPHYSLYIAVTVLIGGLVGGLSAWSGAHLRKLTNPHGKTSELVN